MCFVGMQGIPFQSIVITWPISYKEKIPERPTQGDVLQVVGYYAPNVAPIFFSAATLMVSSWSRRRFTHGS